MGRHAAAAALRLASQTHLLRSTGRRSLLGEAAIGVSSSSSSNGSGGLAGNSSSRAFTSGSSSRGSSGQQQQQQFFFPPASSRALSSSSAGATPFSSKGEKQEKVKSGGGEKGQGQGQGQGFENKPSSSSSNTGAAAASKEAAAAVASAAAARLREAQAAASSAAASAAATAAATAQELRAQMGLGGGGGGGGGGSSSRGSDNASSSTSTSSNSSSSSSSSSSEEGSKASSWKDRLSSSSKGFSLSSLLSTIKREVAAAVLPEDPAASATRARSAEPAPPSPATSLAALPGAPKSAWQAQWERMHEQLGSHPVFARLAAARDAAAESAPARRARELRERALETWETSDHPLVHRLQGVSDAVFAETEMAQALKEVRSRDPGFDFVRFLRSVRGDVPAVVAAYLAGDSSALSAHCSPDLVERVAAVHAASRAQRASGSSSSSSSNSGGSGSGGSFGGGGSGNSGSSAASTPDTSVLDVGEPELVDLKFLDGDPAAVVSFTCQQINCERDAFGNVTEGSPDDVQRVYYYWALVQEASGFVGVDGVTYPPRWQIREMMIRGMHHLL